MGQSSSKYAFIEGSVSIVINVILFGLKLWAGIVSGSLALIADAWHTLSDSASSIMLIVGERVAQKPPDHEHPFGHGRAQIITALFIGFLLAFVAVEFSIKGVNLFLEPKSANFGRLAIIVTIVSILLKEALAQMAFYYARKSGNPALKADGWHHRGDALSSVAVLIGIFLSDYWWGVDALLSLIIAGMLFYASFSIFREGIHTLLGEKPDKKQEKRLNQICADVFGDNMNLHHVHIHRYGHHYEVTFHVELRSDKTLAQVHDLMERAESRIRDEMDMEATIHPEPEGAEQLYGSDR